MSVPQERKGVHKFGWIRDLPDIRDSYFRVVAPEEIAALPVSVDLRPTCSPIVNQGDLGSCTANALSEALGFLEIKDNVNPDTLFSRLFIYYNERVIEGTVSSDSGAQIRDGITTLTQQGACYETTWPYDVTEFTDQPPAAAYTEGAQHIILTYQRITNQNQMQAALASGYPFVFGITVYESFESANATSTGIIPMPQPNEQVLGGHALLSVGYDNTNQWFIFQNSWGTSWGANGFGYLPYAYMTNGSLASDFWYIQTGENE